MILDETQLIGFGRCLAPFLAPGDLLALHGDLGAGKSTLARAILQGLGAEEDVPSPTFTLVQTYDFAFPVWHVDLYRLDAPEDALELGLEEAYDTALCLIEWPERLGASLPAHALHLRLALTGDETTRTLTLEDSPLARPALQDAVRLCSLR